MTGTDGRGLAASPPAAPPAPPDVAAIRLLATLGVGGAVAGLLLVFFFGWTLPAIEANRARALDAAIKEVLKAPERYEALYLVDGRLRREVPTGQDPKRLDRVFLGYRADGQRLGFAIMAGDAGFQDVIRLIFGYDPKGRQLLGMKVLESKETPGLGDRIEKDRAFVDQFAGVQVPLVGVKQGKRSRPREVDMITGATISSRAVLRIINAAIARWGPLVEAYSPETDG